MKRSYLKFVLIEVRIKIINFFGCFAVKAISRGFTAFASKDNHYLCLRLERLRDLPSFQSPLTKPLNLLNITDLI